MGHAADTKGEKALVAIKPKPAFMPVKRQVIPVRAPGGDGGSRTLPEYKAGGAGLRSWRRQKSRDADASTILKLSHLLFLALRKVRLDI